MKFEKGHPKVGGRRKGTKNRSSRLRDAFVDLGFDIPDEARKLYRELADPVLKVRMMELFVKYNEPVPTTAGDAKRPSFEPASGVSDEDLLEGLI